MRKLSHIQQHYLSQLSTSTVCTNSQGKGGNAAGIIIMNDLGDMSAQEKMELVELAKLHEVAFLEIKGGVYNVEFFNDKQEIPLCGHLSLAIANTLFDKSKFSIDITLKAKGGDILLTKCNGIPSVALKRSDKDALVAHPIEKDSYFDLTQKKEIIISTPERVAQAHTEDLKDRAVLYAAKVPDSNEYTTRFFRNGKEDPFHLSGLVPLATILEIEDTTFISSNGGKATLVLDKESDSFSLSGNYNKIEYGIER